MATTHPEPDDRQRLEAAFEQFNVISGELISAYRQLEGQVVQLNAELEDSNRKLRLQLEENAALVERLGLLLTALPAGVVEVAPDGRVARLNPAAEALLGRDRLGAPWEGLAALFEPTDVENVFMLHGLPPATRLTLQYQALPAQGGAIVLIHDVSRQHELTTRLAQQEKLAAMGGMAASLAHQLRTPLATALLYTANLKREGLPEQERERFIDKALSRLRALEGLIQNMLGFVRGQVGQAEPLQLGSLLDELGVTMEPQCRAKSVGYECRAEPPAVLELMADRKALLGALLNLLENALHYSPSGGKVILSVHLQGGLRFVIEDDGPGIPAEALQQVFEPFFTTRSGGTGLGLSIVKKVAEELGGSVVCENRDEGGARFTLCLPSDLLSKCPP
jgi:two-component system sensor histidine kinase FlrB